METIHSFLADVQHKLKVPKANLNTFGKYKYRTCEDILEAVKPLLSGKATLTLGDDVVCVGAHNYIKATATVYYKSEKLEVTALARESVTKKGMDDSQITGTSSSYARKYALNGMFCIDDTADADTMDNTNPCPIVLNQAKQWLVDADTLEELKAAWVDVITAGHAKALESFKETKKQQLMKDQ